MALIMHFAGINSHEEPLSAFFAGSCFHVFTICYLLFVYFYLQVDVFEYCHNKGTCRIHFPGNHSHFIFIIFYIVVFVVDYFLVALNFIRLLVANSINISFYSTLEAPPIIGLIFDILIAEGTGNV